MSTAKLCANFVFHFRSLVDLVYEKYVRNSFLLSKVSIISVNTDKQMFLNMFGMYLISYTSKSE